ncbi:MAG: hypothetical protein HQM08_27260 [Candidatus Riflebacteria bacterium]|nr:hypothetical protein [Candidatus Riflebacteria bacterium]
MRIFQEICKRIQVLHFSSLERMREEMTIETQFVNGGNICEVGCLFGRFPLSL